MSFADLKKQSKLGSLTAKTGQGSRKDEQQRWWRADDRLWKPEVIRAATVMLLSVSCLLQKAKIFRGAKMYSHAFQGPGGWYIENSLTTLGQKDPVSEYNSVSGTTALMQVKMLPVSRSVNSLHQQHLCCERSCQPSE